MGTDRSVAFFDRQFERWNHLVPGGTMVVNVLLDGTTYMDKFDLNAHCLLPRSFQQTQFSCWQVIPSAYREFAALGDKVKSFATTGSSSHPCPAW